MIKWVSLPIEENIMDEFDFLTNITGKLKLDEKIDPALYTKYNVKRGLRNADATGVVVGMTKVGDVQGYHIIDGEKIPDEGKLFYRGINVQDLVNACQREKRFGFEEVCYLLLTGELPDKNELSAINTYLGQHRQLPAGFCEDMIMKAPSKNIMNKISRSVLAAYSYDGNPDDTSLQNVLRQSLNLIAMMPAMAAYAYNAKIHYHDGKSLYIHNPQPELSTAENLLYMIRPDSKYTREEAELLDLALMLHAEHGGGNNSSFTIRVVSSTGTDTYSAVSSAINSLKGPKHGGANHQIMGMFDELKSTVTDWDDERAITDYLTKILKKEAYDRSGLVYGMGHAVYTISDPRAVMLKKKAKELAIETGNIKEFELYERVERLTPNVFREVTGKKKVMCANVDMYSGFVYSMLKIPPELFTPVFAMSRLAGWCAHRIEEITVDPKIIRPAYKNIGGQREYIDLADRY